MEKKRYRKAVFVVVYAKENDKVEYLIFKRKKHWKGWEFTKGGVDNPETIKQCIFREVKEETGQKPLKINWYCKKGKFRYDRKFKERPGFIGQSYVLISAEIKKKKIKIDKKEHSGYKWVNYKQALKRLTWPNQRSCLRMVDKKIS